MKKIDKRFIDEALNIRESYLKTLTGITKYENEIKEINNNLLKSYEDLENNNIDPNNMDKRISKLTEDINKLQEFLKPLVNNVNELEKRSDILYETILSKHDDLTKDDIPNILLPHLSKVDKKFEDSIFKKS